MLLIAILAFAPIHQAQSVDPVEGDEIVVRGSRRKCQMSVASRILSDAEFKARAAEWAAGRPVRVLVPAGTTYKCRARIMFRLNDHGVTRAQFIDTPVE